MSSDNYDEDLDFEEPEEWEYAPDPKTQEVKGLMLKLLEDNPTRVYYQRQIEVKYEKQYFHWVTYRAIREIGEESKALIKFHPLEIGGGFNKLKIITNRKNRYYKREARKAAKLVEEYSSPDVTREVGFMAEELFKVAYARYGYMLVGEHTNEYNGKKWKKTEHNIDFIVEKKGKVFGCEVKNTLGYIDKGELDIKIELCKYLNIIPIFILRYSPTVWNDEIIKQGGLVQIFETQVFSPGKAKLVRELKNKLGLPVLVSKRIPDSIMERLEKRLEKHVF